MAGSHAMAVCALGRRRVPVAAAWWYGAMHPAGVWRCHRYRPLIPLDARGAEGRSAMG